MGQPPAVAEYQAVMSYLASKWTRSAMSAYAQGVTIPDPGHGLDAVCPLVGHGQPFDPEDPARVAPFTPAQVRSETGFLVCALRPLRGPETVTPGATPMLRSETMLEILIHTPGNRGPALAHYYAGALAMILRFATWEPTDSDLVSIRNREAPPERPTFRGDDNAWRYDLIEVPLSLYMYGRVAGAA